MSFYRLSWRVGFLGFRGLLDVRDAVRYIDWWAALPPLTHGGRRLEFELKPLSKEALAKALDRAEHYRLLNEPEQAESVCRDILRIDPDNQQALTELLLSLTDQFGYGVGRLARAEEIIGKLQDEYKRSYYTGIICERQASLDFHGSTNDAFPLRAPRQNP